MKIFNINTDEEKVLEPTESTTEFCLGLSKMFTKLENDKMAYLFEKFKLSESEVEDFDFQSDKFIVVDAAWGGGTSDYTFIFGKTFKSEELAQEWIHSKLYQVSLGAKEMEILVLDKEKMAQMVNKENQKTKEKEKSKEIVNKKIEELKVQLIKEHPILKWEIDHISLI